MNDVLEALKKAGFENFLEELTEFIKGKKIVYLESENTSESNKKRKNKDENQNKMEEEV